MSPTSCMFRFNSTFVLGQLTGCKWEARCTSRPSKGSSRIRRQDDIGAISADRQIMTGVAAGCKHDRSTSSVVGRSRKSGVGEKRRSFVDGPAGCAAWMPPSPLFDPICAKDGHGTSMPLITGRPTRGGTEGCTAEWKALRVEGVQLWEGGGIDIDA